MSSNEPLDLDDLPGRGDPAHGAHGFTIRDLAAQFQLTYRALRFYESRGLLTPRHTQGRRVYTQEDRERLDLLVWGKRMGFTLAEIGEMIEARRRGAAAPKQTLLQLDQTVERLNEMIARRDEIVAAIAELRRHLATLG